jgi:RNA polymerase sigma factor (sigma-70 family)
MQDDAEILRRYLSERSQAAFAELVERHLKVVYYAALRQVNGDIHLAQDVTQVVFAKLSAKARALRQRASLVGWLYVTTRFEAARAARAERRRRARETKAHTMQEILNEPDMPVDWEQLKPVIDDILYALDKKERELVLLRYFEGIPYPEIAARVGGTAEAARFRLDRTLEKIRVRLAKRGYGSTAAALALALGGQTGLAAPSGLAATISVASFSIPTAGGVAAMGILKFMNTSKILVGVALVVGAVGTGLSLRERSIAARTESTLLALNQQNETLSAQVESLQKTEEGLSLAGGTSRAATVTAQVNQPNGTAAVAAPTGKSGVHAANAPGAAQSLGVNRELSNDPAVRSGLAGWITACQNVTEGPLFKSLGLSADKIESLDALQLQFDINMGDNVLTLRPEGATVEDVDQSIHTLLGDADFQQFRTYQSTQFVREVASSLAGNLFDSDTPLTGDQAEQLTQILAQNSSTAKGAPPFPGEINWNAALTQAQTVLSTQQVEVLGNLATVIGSQPGLWGSLNPISPGSTGRTSGPPPAFFASSAAQR